MSKIEELKGGKFKLNDVRLSYPNLFKTAVFDGEDTGRFGATFLIPKGTKGIELMEEAVKIIKKEKGIKKIKADNILIKDGDEIAEDKDDTNYEGMWVIRASTNKRVTIIDRDKTPLIEEDDKPYAGCKVNAIISMYGYNNKSEGVSANLLGVQFHADGDRLGGGVPISDDDFDSFDDEDDL